MRELAEDIRLFALNAQIRAARLRETGLALGVIANLMSTRSDATATQITEIEEELGPVAGVLGTLAFDLSLATLQGEMVTRFVEELSAATSGREGSAGDTRAVTLALNVRALGGVLRSGVAPLLQTLADLDRRVLRVASSVDVLTQELNRLHSLQVAGRVESARLGDSGDFNVLFEDVRQQIAAGRANLRGFDVLETWRTDRSLAGAATSMRLYFDRIERWVDRASSGARQAAA